MLHGTPFSVHAISLMHTFLASQSLLAHSWLVQLDEAGCISILAVAMQFVNVQCQHILFVTGLGQNSFIELII